MTTEETPLIIPPDDLHGGDIYARFNKSEKLILLIVISISGFIPLFVHSSFVPSIPQIAEDLNISGSTVGFAVSASVLANALGGLVWSAYITFYGRRPILLWGMPLMAIGSLGAGYSTDIFNLVFWRFVQNFGCAAGMAIGPPSLGDIFELTERGTAIGEFFGVALFGLAIGPLVGGAAAQWWSWRAFQISLGIWGLIHMVIGFILLPETAHPGTRGIDKVEGSKKMRLWINPFSSLYLMRSPVFIAVTLAGTFALLSDYVLLVPMAYTMGERYNITDQGLIGACFVPSGVGNFLGAIIAGRLSDKMVKKSGNDAWYPEDRLRVALFGALFLIPLSVSIAGLVITYVGGTVGLIILLICLFTNGFGVDMVLPPLSTYAVDVMGDQSAEASAAIGVVKFLLLAPLSTLILPSINYIGVVATNLLAALLVLIGYFLLWLTIRYGDRMRAYVDVGYQIADDSD